MSQHDSIKGLLKRVILKDAQTSTHHTEKDDNDNTRIAAKIKLIDLSNGNEEFNDLIKLKDEAARQGWLGAVMRTRPRTVT